MFSGVITENLKGKMGLLRASISVKVAAVNKRENIMLRDLALAAKAACSQEDQESLVSIVRILKDLGDKVKKRGILSLEEEQSSIEDRFFRIGLQLIIDQSAPEIVRDILDSDIYYNESNGRELLKKIIIREGLLHIQAGDTARNILLCTRIFLGKVDVATFDRLYG